MKLSQFRFDLPEELIAKYPAVHRDESRLMVVHRESDELEHIIFKDILDYFEEKDFFIFNDTKSFSGKIVWIQRKNGRRDRSVSVART